MQVSSKLLVRTAIVLLGLLLAVTMFVVVSNANNQAKAMTTTDWATVATSINGYVTSQYDSAAGGEKGYLETAASVRAYLDTNSDGVLLGEGDNAVNAPVLVDVLTTQLTLIPGTSIRVANGTAADTTNGPAVAGKVTGHRNAGFSTEIVTYCLTGHAQSPITMAYGAMSAAGYFGSPSPQVKGLKWGRQGWNYAITGAPVYPYATTGNRPATANLVTPAVNTLPAGGACTGGSGTAELVRCTAQASIAGAGTGQMPWASGSDATYLPVDLRSVVGADTRSYLGSGTANNGAGYSIATEFGTLFSSSGTYSNLKKLPPTGKTLVFASPTMHTGLMAAEGATMLGYTAKGLRWGMPYWNALSGSSDPNWSEKLNTSSPDYKTYAYNTVTSGGGIDTTAPTLSGIGYTATTSTATITWATTADPTTSMVEYGPGLASKVNDTVLHASHSVTLTGLSPNTTYDYKVTSYDGNANGSSSTTLTLTTAAPPNTPPVVTVPADITAEATGPSGAVVTFTATATDAEDGALIPVCTPASGSTFPLGITSVSCTATDSGGLTDTKSFNVTVVDTTGPAVTYVGPTGTVGTSSPTITGTATDAVGVTTVSVSIDGGTASACTIDGLGNVSCATSGLADGLHTAVITAGDGASNSGTASGSFTVSTCTPAKPNLGIRTDWAKWASYADYTARELSVKLTVSNAGTTTGYGVAITGSANTNGVTLSTATPIALGDIAGSGSATTWVKYHIPVGVTGFSAVIGGSASDTCGIGYTYP